MYLLNKSFFHSYSIFNLKSALKTIPVALYALFVFVYREKFVFIIVAKSMMSPATFKGLLPALIGPPRPSSRPRNDGFSVFIVLGRDVKTMSCELCHLLLEVIHCQPFLCQISSDDLSQKHGGESQIGLSKIFMFRLPSNLRNLTTDAGSVLFIFRSLGENEPEAMFRRTLCFLEEQIHPSHKGAIHSDEFFLLTNR